MKSLRLGRLEQDVGMEVAVRSFAVLDGSHSIVGVSAQGWGSDEGLCRALLLTGSSALP